MENEENNKLPSEEDPVEADPTTLQQRQAEATKAKIDRIVDNLEPHVQGQLQAFEDQIEAERLAALGEVGDGTGDAAQQLGAGDPLKGNGYKEETRERAAAWRKQASPQKGPPGWGSRGHDGEGESLGSVQVFTVESRLRLLLEEILAPIVIVNKENNGRLVSLEKANKDIEIMQGKINLKLDADKKLRDLVEDTKVHSEKFQKEAHKEIDDLRRKLMDTTQVMNVHEDRMSRLTDDKKIFEASRDQLRNDIRQFEILCQDISMHNREALTRIEHSVKVDISRLQEQIDTLTETNEAQNYIIEMEKDKFQSLQNQVGWNKYNLDQLLKATEDLPVLYKQTEATERYLHKILPIKTETQIYNSVLKVTTDQKIKKGLMEYTSQVINGLLTDQQDEELEFDKRKFVLPDIKTIVIKEVVEPKPDAKPAIKLVPKKEVEEPRSPAGDGASLLKGPKSDKSGAKRAAGDESGADDDATSPERMNMLMNMHPELFAAQSAAGIAPKDLKFTRQQTVRLAHRIGRHFLRDEGFMDDLADALDGIDLTDELSQTESDEYASSEEEQVAQKKSKGARNADETLNDSEPNEDNKQGARARGSRSSGEASADERSAQEDGSQGSASPKRSRKKSRRATINEAEVQLDVTKDKKKRNVRFQEDSRDSQDEKGVIIGEVELESGEGGTAADALVVPKGKEKASSKAGQSSKSSTQKRSSRHTSRNENTAPSAEQSSDDGGHALKKQSTRRSKRSSSKPTGSRSRDREGAKKGQHDRTELEEESEPEYASSKRTKRSTKPKGEISRQQSTSDIDEYSENTPRKRDQRNTKSKRDRSKISLASASHTSSNLSAVKVVSPGRRGERNRSSAAQGQATSPGRGSKGRGGLRAGKDANKAARTSSQIERGSSGASFDLETLGEAVRDLEEQMSTVRRRLHMSEGGQGPAKLDAGGSESASDDEVAVGRYVEHEQFKRTTKQLTEVRKTITELRTKLHELDGSRGLLGAGSPASDTRAAGSALSKHDTKPGHPAMSTSISAKGINEYFKEIQNNVQQSVSQIDLLKDEIKIELKRLQRQNFQVSAGFDQQQEFLDKLASKIDTFDRKLVLTDTSMATIFKLLRIQYALSHQDELDKQEIFLMGARDANGGKGNQSGNTANYQPLLDQSIDFEDQNSLICDNNSLGSNHPNLFSGQSKRTVDTAKRTQRDQGHQILAFDRSCMLCAGQGTVQQQLPSLMKAFKMACLSYKPSQVIFEQKTFDRNQLLEAQGYLLYLAIQHLKHLDFAVVERTLLGSAGVDEMSDRSEHSPNQGSRALPKNHVLNQTNSLTQDFQRSVDSVDSIGDQSADHGHRTRAAMASASMNQSLDNSHLNLSQRLTDNKMISLSKSKEYSKLANQIPTIFNIENGHKVLNNNDLRNAGINPVNTLHEKYQQNLKELKQFTTSRYSHSNSKLAMHANRGAPGQRISINTTAAADRSQLNEKLPNLSHDIQKTLNKGVHDAVLNDGVMGVRPLYRSKINELSQISTPLIKNKRRFAAGLVAHELGSVDMLTQNSMSRDQAHYDTAQNARPTKLKHLGVTSNSQAMGGILGSIGSLAGGKTSTANHSKHITFSQDSAGPNTARTAQNPGIHIQEERSNY